MVHKSLVRIALAFAVYGAIANAALGDAPKTLAPTAIEPKSEPCGDGWTRWDTIGNVEGAMTYRERISALAAKDNDIWVGTSYGRLLTRQKDKWTLQGRLDGIQITGIAVENADKVWISTSDGIRRLDREGDQPWRINEFRDYYEGHPSFVSGGYIPGEDAVRLWGYVDDIYIPPGETAYSPLVISTEHGLFCWGGYGRVWHHYNGDSLGPLRFACRGHATGYRPTEGRKGRMLVGQGWILSEGPPGRPKFFVRKLVDPEGHVPHLENYQRNPRLRRLCVTQRIDYLRA